MTETSKVSLYSALSCFVAVSTLKDQRDSGGSPRDFGEQGNIGKILKGTREH